jgi:hypothetical protein
VGEKGTWPPNSLGTIEGVWDGQGNGEVEDGCIGKRCIDSHGLRV